MLPVLVELSLDAGLDLSELMARIASDAPNAFLLANYPLESREQVREAVAQAWEWLRGENLIVEKRPGLGGFRWILSKTGIDLAHATDPIFAIKNEKIQLLSRPGPIVAELIQSATAIGFDTVQRDVARALLSAADDPEDAVTAACSLIEAVCRSILSKLGLALPAKKDIDGLMKAVQDALGISPGQHGLPTEISQDVRQLLGGLTTVTKGVGALRTHGGDAHGREAGFHQLDSRTARLAVNAAGSAALFLIETWQEHEKRKLPKHAGAA